MAKDELRRFKGDTYPLEITLIDENDKPIDLRGASLTLYYQAKSITGTLSGTADEGKVTFIPLVTDFDVAGTHKYKIVQTIGAYKKTLIKSTITIDDDSVASV